eukprot:TRINITY_DN61040_c0_g1_i1.p1 TRINITY_DN61040_c0_g1~~TRINITY_DN61040_c0_g1_i1.p1  ORF type:complete len:389 (-),score=65.79 TRINITY_DN61040_c0_g1_i1:67-1233(-)
MPAAVFSLISGSSGRRERSRLQVLLKLLAIIGAALCAILAGLERSFVNGAQGQLRTFGRSRLARRCEPSQMDDLPPMGERVILVTGSTGGIGKFTAEKLLKRGCTVLFHGRGEAEHMVEQCKEYMQEYRGRFDAFLADLSEPEEVESLAELIMDRYPEIHGVLHNAATIDGDFTGGKKLTFGNKHEHTISTNTLAPFLLTAKLVPALSRARYARVILSSSQVLHRAVPYLDDLNFERKWTGLHAYKLSKLCSEMMIREMHLRYGDPPYLTFHSIDPGTVDTKLFRQGSYYGTGKRKGRGNRGTDEDLEKAGLHRLFPHVRTATASYKALVDDRFQLESGSFIADAPRVVHDARAREQLWNQLESMTNAKWPKVRNVQERLPQAVGKLD